MNLNRDIGILTFILLICRYELQRGRVDAVPLVGGGRPVVEHMAEVRPAPRLYPLHEEAPVGLRGDVLLRDRFLRVM